MGYSSNSPTLKPSIFDCLYGIFLCFERTIRHHDWFDVFIHNNPTIPTFFGSRPCPSVFYNSYFHHDFINLFLAAHHSIVHRFAHGSIHCLFVFASLAEIVQLNFSPVPNTLNIFEFCECLCCAYNCCNLAVTVLSEHIVHGFVNLSPSEELKQGMPHSEEMRQSLLLYEMSASLKLWTSLRLNSPQRIEVF